MSIKPNTISDLIHTLPAIFKHQPVGIIVMAVSPTGGTGFSFRADPEPGEPFSTARQYLKYLDDNAPGQNVIIIDADTGGTGGETIQCLTRLLGGRVQTSILKEGNSLSIRDEYGDAHFVEHLTEPDLEVQAQIVLAGASLGAGTREDLAAHLAPTSEPCHAPDLCNEAAAMLASKDTRDKHLEVLEAMPSYARREAAEGILSHVRHMPSAEVQQRGYGMIAHAFYLAGDGTRANICIDHAGDDSLAQLTDQLIRLGIDPANVTERLKGEKV